MASHILTYAVRNALEDGQREKGDSHSEIQMEVYGQTLRQTVR
jgi:hypothetical protein